MKGLKHALVLLLAVSSLASCRLVNNFMAKSNNNNGGCPQFFLNGQSPTILQDNNNVNRYQQICQDYLGADRFATLYDTKNKIPVYSAYLHVPHVPTDRTNQWRTEPGLQANQATNADYTNSGYDRGHLYPAYNNNDPGVSDATFTLTNAAPQKHSFNVQSFNKIEKPVNVLIQNSCGGNQGYIVTGVVPDPKQTIGNKVTVRVALGFWTAFCCLNNNKNIKAQGAFLMYPNGDLDANITNLQDLENVLKYFYGQIFRVFGGQC